VRCSTWGFVHFPANLMKAKHWSRFISLHCVRACLPWRFAYAPLCSSPRRLPLCFPACVGLVVAPGGRAEMAQATKWMIDTGWGGRRGARLVWAGMRRAYHHPPTTWATIHGPARLSCLCPRPSDSAGAWFRSCFILFQTKMILLFSHHHNIYIYIYI
jgi:hypothetical protein